MPATPNPATAGRSRGAMRVSRARMAWAAKKNQASVVRQKATSTVSMPAANDSLDSGPISPHKAAAPRT